MKRYWNFANLAIFSRFRHKFGSWNSNGANMISVPDFPILDSPAKCVALWPKYPNKTVGIWATGLPQQNVDVLWRLREELLKLGVPTVFFFTESAKLLLHDMLAQNSSATLAGDIYQLDDSRFFRLLNFVDVLVTNEYRVGYKDHRHIGAKLLSIKPTLQNPCGWNYFYDYGVTSRDPSKNLDYTYIDGCKIDYGLYPDICKIHRNDHFTQLVVGHVKIDLLLEERQKKSSISHTPVLLLYPTYMDFCMTLQKISPEKYVEIWAEAASSYLAWRPEGLVVFRPVLPNHSHPQVIELQARFANDGRFIVDTGYDNKFWIARADYFVTDYSQAHINFSLSAKKPTLRMVHTENVEEPKRDEWGWTISRPAQVVPLLQQMDMEEKIWAESLRKVQEREMPTLGRNFALLADMIQRIFHNDDDPAWFRVAKGHTPCRTRGDLLRLVAKGVKYEPFTLYLMHLWLNDLLSSTQDQETPKIWLGLLKRALLPRLDTASPLDCDVPLYIARYINEGLTITLVRLPVRQTVGLLRHCMRKDASLTATALLLTATSRYLRGPEKKRALFFLLMEWARYDPSVLQAVNDLAEKMPQHFSGPVLGRLNRVLPRVMKVPLPMRRLGAMALGLKKPLAKKYWRAHRELC